MILTRAGSQPSAKVPAEYFTGTVRIDAPFQATAPARVGGATVRIAEALDGKAVTWMEQVSEADYQAGLKENRHGSE